MPAEGNTGRCSVCGKPGFLHVTTVGLLGRKTSQSYCTEHVPTEHLPKGWHPGRELEASVVRGMLEHLDDVPLDPAKREEAKAQLMQLLADIEAGRKRLGDEMGA
jgi:hypothetical protein